MITLNQTIRSSSPRRGAAQSLNNLTSLLALTMIGASTFQPSPIFAQTAKQAPSKQASSKKVAAASPATIRANQLKLLRGRLAKAQASSGAAYQVLRAYPVFYLQGTIERGNGQEALIWGTSFGVEHTSGSAMGWATEKKLLKIRGYRRSDVQMDTFGGRYMAVSQTEYVPVPAAYEKALDTYNQRAGVVSGIEAEIAAIASVERQQKRQLALAQKARLDAAAALRVSTEQQRQRIEAQTLIAQFQAPYLKQIGSWTEPEQFLEYSEALISYYRQQVAQSPAGEKFYGSLRDEAILQGVKAATLFARRGAVDVSAVILVRRLWTSTPLRPEANLDTSAIYGAQNFAAPAAGIFDRQSALLGELMAAWVEGYPLYAKQAPYDELLDVRKIGEVLARSAGKYSLPQRGQLVAALKPEAGHETAQATLTAPDVDAPDTTTGENNAPLRNAPKVNAPQAPEARKPAFDFYLRDIKTDRTYQLSDFLGKVVVLYLPDFGIDDKEANPSRMERFGQFSKDYDSSKVVFLCVIDEFQPGYLRQEMATRTNPKRAENGQAIRQYPDLYMMGTPNSDLDQTPENFTKDRKVQSEAYTFYNGKQRYEAKPVTVIDAQGQVVGATNFNENRRRSEQNMLEDLRKPFITRQTYVFEFDKDALDALIIRALAPAKKVEEN